jgi:hypothetical protein
VLSLTPALVPHVVRLLPALRSGAIHRDLAPIVTFAQAAGPDGRDILKGLQSCPGFLFDAIAQELNQQLTALNTRTRVTARDLQQLSDVSKLYWQTLSCYI